MALKTNYKVGDAYTSDSHNQENTQINTNQTDIASIKKVDESQTTQITTINQFIDDLGIYIENGYICQKEI